MKDDFIDDYLYLLKEKTNPLMWNKVFFNKLCDYFVDIVSKYNYKKLDINISNDGNNIIIKPIEKNDISKNWNCYPVYEITYYLKENVTNYIIGKRSYVNLNDDNIPDVSIFSSSETYNSDGVCEYHSKYYDMFTLGHKMTLDEFITKTDVRYEKGKFMEGPKISNKPEISKEFRFQRTNVMLETNIIDGIEETYLDLTLDDDNNDRIKLARKMNGNYYDNDHLIDDNLYHIVNSVDSLYHQCLINYSPDKFLELFHKYAIDNKSHK